MGKKRMQLSFGSTKEDEEVYNYLKNEVSNASALVRMLVKCYKDGRAIGGSIELPASAPVAIPVSTSVETKEAEKEIKKVDDKKDKTIGGNGFKSLKQMKGAFKA